MQQDRLQDLIEPLVESIGYELVLLEFMPQGNAAILRLYIDRPGDAPGAGVTLGDCEVVSREVAAQLDVDDPIRTPYQLEVSSPGLDRPLTKPSHFSRFCGEKARVELTLPLNGQRRFVGRIAGASDQGVRLATDRGETELAFNAIARARLVPNYSIRTAEGES